MFESAKHGQSQVSWSRKTIYIVVKVGVDSASPAELVST